MPDSNVRWLEVQHTPLPNQLVQEQIISCSMNKKQQLCRRTEADGTKLHLYNNTLFPLSCKGKDNSNQSLRKC